ncbi:enoyl-CoA hydratase/isomerase family protein [Nocardia sp. alder85J]|uniref:enoyl-CoA hydratase/isomerase family protein n=1 Tax=Nocardia sp. alder85J TaxID=2862949 RepID=UPI001CD520B1|nr:enoyl-CoA hydratase/isomerase family protein [Nocardia sp. alder85J]MCX4095752.1 enoyl-CoA hydratase/isomerase family protein [Nocardia sp. alder85J]
MTRYSALDVTDDGLVAIVTMNRPATRNAADATMHRELGDIWADLAAHRTIRAVVLTGAGRAFSAGGDLPRMLETQRDLAVQDEVFDEARRIVHGMVNLPRPIVAAVNGPAVGLGASLVALSDLAVAAETAFLADPHLGVGLVPADGTAMLWPLMTGLLRAKEFVLLGERIPAAKALEYGLVNRVVPAEDVLSTAIELAHRLAEIPRRALADTKRILNAGATQILGAALEQALAAERQSVTSPEHIARVQAMVDAQPQ